MDYFVNREGQEFGPYSLAELQKYVKSGNIASSDMARSEAMSEWAPVSQVVGNIPVPPPPGAVNYGQVPQYGAAAPAPGAVAASGPVPPGLHWIVVLLLSIVTFGVFTMLWYLVQATFAHKLRTNSKPAMFYGTGLTASLMAGVFSASGTSTIALILQLAGLVLITSGHYSMKNALETYYNSVEPINLQLSGPMTLFFNAVYFQYHFGRIRRWKRTGQLDA